VRGTNFLFVYGTLRRGAKHPLHRVLANRAELIGAGKFQGKLYDFGHFPGVVPSDRKTDHVVGEIYELHDARKSFQLLDEYEGNLFRREIRSVHLHSGETIESWIYVYVGAMNSAELVRGGDYVAFKERQTSAAVRVGKISSKEDLKKAFAIRMRVFVKEQGVPSDIELDRDDQRAVHFLATVSDKAIGTARIVMRRDSAKIGRMAVLKNYRRNGVGTKLLKRAVVTAKKLGAQKIYLHAQVAVIGFYERLDFRSVGRVFDEAGIPHRKMVFREQKKLTATVVK
jgi:predicted GNAT family N-acyltransferase/gamma-glutamylcyclotransferase (GGCT)/AIG2-like uncharacterized protein YtfP